MARDHRRLAAIVSLDVAGYSRLMGVDDSGTLAALKGHRRELIDPKIAEHDGRIVKTTGDGLLLEFSSVVDAVRCAVDVQRGMAERNAGVAPDKRLDFRIGINIGDIIIDGDDIFGDGVNVAARLEALADPGGICVSRAVRDQVLDKLSFAFEDLGAQQVKNIARAVEVYRVNLGSSSLQTQPRSRRRWERLSRVPHLPLLAVATVILALVATGAWWLPAVINATRTPPSPTVSFAILPFTASTADLAEGQWADSVAADLTSALKRAFPEWSVVSPGLAAAYKGKIVDARVVGRELNVRYLVEGVVKDASGRGEIKARLTETGTGTELWSDNFEVEKIGDNQSRQALVARITNQVKSAIVNAERHRVLALPVSALNADELTQRGDAVRDVDPPTLTALAEARSLYEKALRLNPTLPAALMSQANALSRTLDLDPNADRDRLTREYDEMSLRLVSVAEQEARSWNIRADALRMQWRWEAALEANARAMKLDPTRLNTLGQRAHLLVDMGRPDEALALAAQGLSLQPTAGVAAYLLLSSCRANLALGRYDDAIGACEKAASISDSWPYYWTPHIYLVAAYTLQGNDGRAKAEKTKLLMQQPRFTITAFKALRISDVPAYLQQTEAHLYAGLRKAGIPEN